MNSYATPFDCWWSFTNAMCSLAYEAGREAFCDGLPKELGIELGFDEPVCILGWEAGYEDMAREVN